VLHFEIETAPTDAIPAAHLPYRPPDAIRGPDKAITDALVVSFVMAMIHEFANRIAQRSLPTGVVRKITGLWLPVTSELINP